MAHRSPPAVTGMLLLLPGLLLVALMAGQLAGSTPLSYRLDDPALTANGFYPVEQGEGGVPFRWSRPSAGVLVPALAAAQVISVEVSAPRPAGIAPPGGIRLEANGTSAPLVFAPGWTTLSTTAASQIGLANSVALVATLPGDSFYPGPNDHRLLAVAVRRVNVAPAPSIGGWPLPAPLPGAVLLLLPLGTWAITRRGRERWALAAAGVATIVAGAGVGLLPLPTMLAVAAPVGVGLLLALALAYAGALERSAVALAGRLNPRTEAVWLTAGYTALALLATWPLATRLSTALPGWPGDNFAFLYKIWWVERALRTGANLFYDPNVFAPYGFNFGRGEPTLPNTIPGALIALGGGPVLGYNLVLLAGFVGAGLGTYGLALALGATRGAAFLAGLIFLLAPYHLAQAAGHLQIAATQWLPLTLWGAEVTLARLLAGRTDGRTTSLRPILLPAALTGLVYGLTVLTAWYYALIGGLLLAGYVLMRIPSLLRNPQPPTPKPSPSASRFTFHVSSTMSHAILAALVAALVAGVLVLPGLLPALGAAGEAPLRHSAKAADENSASPEDYLLLNPLHPVWGPTGMAAHSGQNIIESVLYVGWPTLVLAGIALATWWRRGRVAPWAVLAAACFVLSLGLTLHTSTGTAGQALVGGQVMPLPARILYDWVPGFSSLRAYARFGVGVALAGAVLAGLGATALLAWPRLRGRRALVALGLIALVLADLWPAPNAWGLTTVQPDAVAGWLAAQPDGGAVMRLPLLDAIAGPPLYAGTAYGHPLAYGYETFEPPGFAAGRPTLAGFPSAPAFALLREWGVRYVVVAASSYGPDWAATRAQFATLPDWAEAFAAAQPRLWSAPFWVADRRPELYPLLAPDELVVYRLK